MSTLRVNTLQDVAGTGQPAMPGAAKAWVNFNGTGTVAIRAAFNVSSITDNGVGTYTVNFTTALADANYAVFFATRETNAFGAQSVNGLGIERDTVPTASSFRFTSRGTSNGTAFDSEYFSVAAFR